MLHYTDDQQQMLPEVIRKFLYEFTDVDYPSVVVLLLYFINFLKKKRGFSIATNQNSDCFISEKSPKSCSSVLLSYCASDYLLFLVTCVPRVTLLLLFIGAPPADTTFLARCYEYCSSYRFCFRHIIWSFGKTFEQINVWHDGSFF